MDFLKKVGKDLVKDFTGKSDSGSAETWYITAVRAEGIKDKDRFTKSDPYLVIDFGGKSVHTRTINNDLSPTWNETFTFNISNGKAKDIRLKLKDSDIGLDDTIGSAVVSGADFPMYSGEEKYIQIPVTRHEEVHGIVHLKIKKVGGQTNPMYSTSYQQPQQIQQTQQQQQPYSNYPSQSQQTYSNSYQPQQAPYHQSFPQTYPQQNNNMGYYGQPQVQPQSQQQYGSYVNSYSSQGTIPPQSSSQYPSNQYNQQYPSNQYNQQYPSSNQQYPSSNQGYNQQYNQGYKR